MHSYFESEESKYQNKNHMVTKLELQLYKVNGSNNEYTNFSLITDKDTNSQLSKTLKVINYGTVHHIKIYARLYGSL